MVPTFSFSNSELLKTWEKLTAISGSCELDVFAEMQTLNEIKTSKMLFGKDQKKGKRLFHIQKEQAKRGFQDLWKMRLPGFRFIPTEGSLRMKKPNQEATIILQDIIRKRIEEMNTEDARNDDVLTLLLEAYMIDNDPNEPESFKKVGISMDARCIKILNLMECQARQEKTGARFTWFGLNAYIHGRNHQFFYFCYMLRLKS
ncbi:cytochrome P450 CYP72A219-like [Nymphaea colorata]|uniref:cytochrome P450 CYP72A219-like n=1 Tax=Nymphaea colorata TaxID=210225 RepID=UPI00129DE9CE|nr:cytochrome P450 CYP72A219-like [Nymphaea colorata]